MGRPLAQVFRAGVTVTLAVTVAGAAKVAEKSLPRCAACHPRHGDTRRQPWSRRPPCCRESSPELVAWQLVSGDVRRTSLRFSDMACPVLRVPADTGIQQHLRLQQFKGSCRGPRWGSGVPGFGGSRGDQHLHPARPARLHTEVSTGCRTGRPGARARTHRSSGPSAPANAGPKAGTSKRGDGRTQELGVAQR